ncbi:MAG: hypothetical protein DRP45_07110 [Candidatus Zixiibacteriota bacterium]|nr:MAG: hypothetical protein DRP45_07110 [candidate division Zixibacteria bacterium]
MSTDSPEEQTHSLTTAETGIEDEGETLEWTCHPVKRRPWVSIAVTLFITLVGVIIDNVTGSRLFAIFGVLVLFASLAKFYFPTTFRLTEKHVIIKTTTQTIRREWNIYRSSYTDKNGLLLSTFAEPSRLENFRGQYIMFNDNADEVKAFVKRRIISDKQEQAADQTNGGKVGA